AAICTAVAASLDGTLVREVARPVDGTVRIGHAAGVLEIGVEVESGQVRSVSTYRTARRIMDGRIYVPAQYLGERAWYRRERGLTGAHR
ncbi:MAG: hypothetical protein H0V51_08720, partial [Chloroflexi bacterium]|nr:hypothetical protein [Chloroflexota bacterium]